MRNLLNQKLERIVQPLAATFRDIPNYEEPYTSSMACLDHKTFAALVSKLVAGFHMEFGTGNPRRPSNVALIGSILDKQSKAAFLRSSVKSVNRASLRECDYPIHMGCGSHCITLSGTHGEYTDDDDLDSSKLSQLEGLACSATPSPFASNVSKMKPQQKLNRAKQYIKDRMSLNNSSSRCTPAMLQQKSINRETVDFAPVDTPPVKVELPANHLVADKDKFLPEELIVAHERWGTYNAPIPEVEHTLTFFEYISLISLVALLLTIVFGTHIVNQISNMVSDTPTLVLLLTFVVYLPPYCCYRHYKTRGIIKMDCPVPDLMGGSIVNKYYQNQPTRTYFDLCNYEYVEEGDIYPTIAMSLVKANQGVHVDSSAIRKMNKSAGTLFFAKHPTTTPDLLLLNNTTMYALSVIRTSNLRLAHALPSQPCNEIARKTWS